MTQPENRKTAGKHLLWLGILAVFVLAMTVWLMRWDRLETEIASKSKPRPRKVVNLTNELDSVSIFFLGRTNDVTGGNNVTLLLTNSSLLNSYRYFYQAEVKSNGTWVGVRGWYAGELSLNNLSPRKGRSFIFPEPDGAEVWRVKFWGPQVAGTALGQAASKAMQHVGMPKGTQTSFTEYSPEIHVGTNQLKPSKAIFENN